MRRISGAGTGLTSRTVLTAIRRAPVMICSGPLMMILPGNRRLRCLYGSRNRLWASEILRYLRLLDTRGGFDHHSLTSTCQFSGILFSASTSVTSRHACYNPGPRARHKAGKSPPYSVTRPKTFPVTRVRSAVESRSACPAIASLIRAEWSLVLPSSRPSVPCHLDHELRRIRARRKQQALGRVVELVRMGPYRRR